MAEKLSTDIGSCGNRETVMKHRVHIRAVPATPQRCLLAAPCVYRNDQTICNMPRYNKGNSDALYHKYSNIKLLDQLRDPFSDNAMTHPSNVGDANEP
jgi:hypothetical protein